MNHWTLPVSSESHVQSIASSFIFLCHSSKSRRHFTKWSPAISIWNSIYLCSFLVSNLLLLVAFPFHSTIDFDAALWRNRVCPTNLIRNQMVTTIYWSVMRSTLCINLWPSCFVVRRLSVACDVPWTWSSKWTRGGGAGDSCPTTNWTIKRSSWRRRRSGMTIW